jgi:hypothetical protein
MPSPQDFYGFYPRKVFVDYLLVVQAAQTTEVNRVESYFPSAFRKTPSGFLPVQRYLYRPHLFDKFRSLNSLLFEV